jgi:preprotein translocase subunit SecG
MAAEGSAGGALEDWRHRPAAVGYPRRMIQLVLNVLLVLSSSLLIVLILLHRGKGGGLSSMFGGAVSSSLSGSSVVEKNLNRLTVFTALIWTICIIALGILVKLG